MILGLDVSHFQAPVNFPAAKSAGRDFVVLKVTEGIGYTDPTFTASRKAAHAAGLIVGLYHFARDNSPAAEAAYFIGAIGALQRGEFLVLDQEVAHAGGNVPWCAAWLGAVTKATGVAPLIYMNQGSSTGAASGDWTQVAKTYGLWLAKYDNAPATQTSVAYWGPCAMKQYSDAGSVLGVAGTCDVDAFYGTTDQLRAYGYGSTDMPLTQADADLVATTLLNRNVNRAGGPTGQTNLGQTLAWLDANLSGIPAAVWSADVHGTSARDRVNGMDAIQLPAIAKAVAAIPTATPGSVTVDAAAVATALAADTAAMDRLAAAIAAQIATRLGNG